MSWLDDMLAQLQGGGAPAAFSPAASPFPDVVQPASPAEEAAAAAAAREAAGARMVRANQRRVDPFAFPDQNSAGVQLAMGQGPAGTGVPVEGSPQFAPMSIGGVPQSVQLASSMAKPPPQMQPQAPVQGLNAPVGGAGPGPAAPPAGGGSPTKSPGMMARDADEQPTDISSARRAPAAPMSMAGSEPSIMDNLRGFGDKLRDISPNVIALGAGLAGEGWDKATQVAALQQKKAEAVQTANLTARALLARGAPAEEVAAAVKSPELLKAMIGKYFETKPAQVVGGRMVRERPGGGVEVLADFSKDEEKKPPSGFRWKDSSKSTLEFIPEGPADPKYLRDKGEKNAAPAGYRWIDPANPDKGLAAIPGGPGEKIDAEVAGRLGLAKSFLGQLPDIKRRVEAGELTGPIDAIAGKAGVGGAGELRRQIDSGAEALLRMLTGAGMNMQEASEYTRRYKFSMTDTSETMLSKLNQLERELNTVGETVGRGRGGWDGIKGGAPATPGRGTVDVGGQKIQWSVN